MRYLIKFSTSHSCRSTAAQPFTRLHAGFCNFSSCRFARLLSNWWAHLSFNYSSPIHPFIPSRGQTHYCLVICYAFCYWCSVSITLCTADYMFLLAFFHWLTKIRHASWFILFALLVLDIEFTMVEFLSWFIFRIDIGDKREKLTGEKKNNWIWRLWWQNRETHGKMEPTPMG